jgi:hypothetical protein
MTNEQVERLLDIADRYVRVEEHKLRLTVDQLRVRNDHEERAVAAQEKLAEGQTVSISSANMTAKVEYKRDPGDAGANCNSDASVPQPGE